MAPEQPIPRWLPTVAFFIGVVGLCAVVVIALVMSHPSPFQVTTFRTLTALAGGAFAMAITGFLSVRLALSRAGVVVAGGSLGVFLILRMF